MAPVTPLRVLAIHLTRPSSSEAKVLAALISHLDPAIEVELVVNRRGLDDPASHFAALAERDSVHIRAVDVGLAIDPAKPRPRVERALWRIGFYRSFNRILRLARESNVDLVYTSQQRFDCRLGEFVATRLGLPHVVHLHYGVGRLLGASAIRRLRTCDRVLAVSRYVAGTAIAFGVLPDKLVVVPNSISVPPSRARTDGSGVVIGQVGRMEQEKGFVTTIEVFERVSRDYPEAHLLLVGDGSERQHVESRAVSAAAAADVRVVGWQTDVDQWLAQIDVFVHPAEREAFGLAALEAMAVGIPVVAYGDGGLGDVIVEGESGFLHEPGDVEGLTSSVRRLVADAALRERIGAAARDRVAQHFNPVVVSARVGSVLREAVAGHQAAGSGRARAQYDAADGRSGG